MARERNSRRPGAGRVAPEAGEPEAVGEEKPGIDVESGMVLTTALLLLVAIVLILKELGGHYGAGPLASSFAG
ncbi:MAG TPA: hypothetical protein VFI25_16330 [Planctomycetota bacterium]|jgi:hypothetical protein|nr:hypothetical protein [Planctomycetota bacterium]